MLKTYLDTGAVNQCCGCGVCADACPCTAISLTDGKDKSKYPTIDLKACVNCGRCRIVCPISSLPVCSDAIRQKAYVAVLEEETQRNKSASGGAFEGIVASLELVYSDLLVVGAVLSDDLSAVHDLRSAKRREAFKKSKYIQSNCVGIYKKVKTSLQNGKAVLFSGTPCHVAGVKRYLGKDYENLYTVDIVCHGVPGAGIFKHYINEIEERYHCKVLSAEFRHKKKDFYGEIHSNFLKLELSSGKTIYRNNKTDEYLRGFHSALFYRESCYSCPFAKPERYGDITLGDYWNIQKIMPELVDYTGVSCVLVNTVKGEEMLCNANSLLMKETEVDFLLKHNGQLSAPSHCHKNRERFFAEFDKKSFGRLINENVGRAKYFKNAVSRLLPGKLKRKMKKLILSKGIAKWMMQL